MGVIRTVVHSPVEIWRRADAALTKDTPAESASVWSESQRRAFTLQLGAFAYLLWRRDLRTPLSLCKSETFPIHAAYRSIVHGAGNALYAYNVLSGLYPISPSEYLLCYVAGRSVSNRTLEPIRLLGELVARSDSLKIARPLITEVCASTLVLFHRIETYARHLRLDDLPSQRLWNSQVWPEALGKVAGALRVKGSSSALVRDLIK